MAEPDFRALCAELADALDACLCGGPSEETADIDDDLITRARAALAQPEAERPTTAELDALWLATWSDATQSHDVAAFARAVLARWGRPEAQSEEPAKEEWFADFAAWLAREMPAGTVVADPLWWAPKIARAVLLHSGFRPAPQPIPITERLPGDQLCWWFEADEDGGYGSNWTLLRIRGSATGYTHWLPHWALPLPQEGQ